MNKTPPMTDNEIATLESNSRMLGRIAGWVSEFADHDESTTEECVIQLIARYRQLQSDNAWRRLDQIRKEKTNQ